MHPASSQLLTCNACQSRSLGSITVQPSLVDNLTINSRGTSNTKSQSLAEKAAWDILILWPRKGASFLPLDPRACGEMKSLKRSSITIPTHMTSILIAKWIARGTGMTSSRFRRPVCCYVASRLSELCSLIHARGHHEFNERAAIIFSVCKSVYFNRELSFAAVVWGGPEQRQTPCSSSCQQPLILTSLLPTSIPRRPSAADSNPSF